MQSTGLSAIAARSDGAAAAARSVLLPALTGLSAPPPRIEPEYAADESARAAWLTAYEQTAEMFSTIAPVPHAVG